ncbi:cation diffusion facilitator family transporter [Desulforudis sp. 1088]|uniref:cation diffusion facilitator family transporter n=1 Tax=unclassified Candidatus Desulforudis TaxID=2635950 RepID=UPI00347819F4
MALLGGLVTLDKKIRIARLSVVSNTLLTVGKLGVGLSTNSVSILSEALHSGLDLVAALIAYFAVWKSGQPADERHQFGHGKYENVAAITEALLILAAAAAIIIQAVPKFFRPHEIHALDLGASVMAVSAVVNLVVSQLLFKTARETDSPALAGDAWHLRTDVYTSLGVFAGLLAIRFTGLTILDPAIAIVIAVVIIKAGIDLLRNSMHSILDAKLPEEDLKVIKNVLLQFDSEYLEFHDLRTRKAGPYRFIDLHLVAPANRPLQDVHSLCDRIEEAIEKRLPRTEMLIHIEPCDKHCDNCDQCPDK